MHRLILQKRLRPRRFRK